jgi:hypothetical protein
MTNRMYPIGIYNLIYWNYYPSYEGMGAVLMRDFPYDPALRDSTELDLSKMISFADVENLTGDLGVLDGDDITFRNVPVGTECSSIILMSFYGTYRTFDVSTQMIQVGGNDYPDGMPVMFSAFENSGGPITGIEPFHVYYIVNSTASWSQFSETPGGPPVAFGGVNAAPRIIYPVSRGSNFQYVLAYIDVAQGLPVAPTGTDITVTWSEEGIIVL